MTLAEWRTVCVCGHDQEDHAYGRATCVATSLGHCVKFISEADAVMLQHSERQGPACQAARKAARADAPKADPTAELDGAEAPAAFVTLRTHVNEFLLKLSEARSLMDST